MGNTADGGGAGVIIVKLVAEDAEVIEHLRWSWFKCFCLEAVEQTVAMVRQHLILIC